MIFAARSVERLQAIQEVRLAMGWLFVGCLVGLGLMLAAAKPRPPRGGRRPW